MTRRIPAVCVVLALLGAVPATAQDAPYLFESKTNHDALKGVTEAFVLIGSANLNDSSASCGITETGFTTAASKALLDNGVRVSVTEFADPTLYVNVTALYFETGQCVSNVLVQLYDYAYATLKHQFPVSTVPVYGKFMLAEIDGINSSSPANHGQRIRDTVFEWVEEIAVDIRIANQ